MNRRTFLKTTAGLSALASTPYLWAAEKTKPKISDEEILASAKARILKHRMGEGTITVRDAHGNRLKHAEIKIEQLNHDFLFGSNFFMFARNGDPKLEEPYRDRFRAVFNYCTLGFYWADYERERGKPRYEYTDQVVEYCQQHGIKCKGHPLVWDHAVSTPPWLPADLKEIEKLSKARVSEIVSRFKGRIDIWDVVNEATHLTEIKEKSRMDDMGLAMGQTEYVAQHVNVARAANPSATLIVNDYKDNEKYFKLLDSLRDGKKLLFDVVGLQSHQHRGAWPLEKVWGICEMFAPLRLPLHFTETTFVSGPRIDKEKLGPTTPQGEAKQAEQTEKFYTTLFSHPAVQAITWWDFSDYGSWQTAGGWLRPDMSPKPVYERMMALIKGEWWTKTSGQTKSIGKFSTRAFYGTHRITVKLENGREASQEVHWKRGEKNHFEVRV